MRLYLDENVPIVLASFLSGHGVDCLTAREAGNLSLSDEEQFVFTAQERRVFVTFNCKDFLRLAERWQAAGRSHAGIILSKELPLPELFRRFRYLVIRRRDQDLTNAIIWLSALPEV